MEPEDLDNIFSMVLDNFSLADRLAHHLSTHADQRVNPPVIEIRLTSAISDVVIPGSNCGLFVTPVIHQACLDVRRVLTFFDLRYGINAGAIEHAISRYDDNYGIRDLGLDSLSPENFGNLSRQTIGCSPDDCIKDMLTYVDKQVAHFTTDPSEPSFESIRLSTQLMSEAILVYAYDALDIGRPQIQLQ